MIIITKILIKGKPVDFYQIPRKCCIKRLAAVIPTQQPNPINRGFLPVFTSFTKSVFSPMATIARTMKNLLTSLIGANTKDGVPRAVATVVITEARIKKRMNVGNIFVKLTF